MSLVVAHAASEQLAITARGLERRRCPQLEGLGWLDVVVVVDQQRPLAASGALSQDHRWPSGRGQFGLEAASREHRRDHLRAGLHAEVLRGDAGLGDQRAQLGEALLEVPFDVAIHGGEVGHVGLRVRSFGSYSSITRALVTLVYAAATWSPPTCWTRARATLESRRTELRSRSLAHRLGPDGGPARGRSRTPLATAAARAPEDDPSDRADPAGVREAGVRGAQGGQGKQAADVHRAAARS